MTDKQITEIATRHQRTMCSVYPSYIIETIEEAIKEALKISCNPMLSEVSPPSEQYPDNEADGIVFCGKCGARK